MMAQRDIPLGSYHDMVSVLAAQRDATLFIALREASRCAAVLTNIMSYQGDRRAAPQEAGTN